jgi:hypothetical protein
MELPTKRFVQSLTEKSPPRKNLRARVVFDAIQQAFDIFSAGPRPECRWMTDPDMVSMLAACAYILIEYLRHEGPEEEIDWDSHDFILARTLRGLMTTLVIAIRRGATREHEGTTFLRSFAIPDWFVEWAKENVDYEPPEFYPTQEAWREATEALLLETTA